MTRRTRRVVIGVVLSVLAGLGLAAGVAGWLFATPSGARFVLERAGELMPGRIELGRVDGPIRGPLRLGRVVYEREGIRLEINELLLRWRPRALLRRQLDVEELAASGVRLQTEATAKEETPFELPQIDLPVNLAVRQATVRGAAVAIGGAEPIRIRSAVLETVSRGDALVIERFDLDSPDLELEVSGSLTPLGAYPVDLDLAWALALPDGTRYRGAGTLEGTLEDLTVRQRLTEPFAAVVEARLLDPLDDLRFDGGAEATGVSLTAIDPAWPAMLVSADLVASGSLDDLEAKGQVSIVTDEYGAVHADLAIEGGAKSWRIERLLLASDRSRAKVSATGTVELDDPPRFDLEAGWTDLRWPLDPAAAAMLLAPSGSLRASGTTASYRIEGGLRAALPATVAASGEPLSIDAQLAIAGDASGARIERLDGRTLGGRVAGEGALSWSPQVDWRLALRGDDLRPGAVDPRLDGDLDLAVSSEGRMTDAGPRGSIVLRRIAGRIHGQPVRGGGRVELRGEQVSIPDLRLVWGDAALAAAGVIGDTLDLRFRLDAPDLGKLLPDVAGSLSIDGALDGPRASPGLEAKVQAASLAIGTLRAKSIAGTVTAGAGERDPLDVVLTVSDLAYGERDFPVARLSAKGSRAEHTLEATLDGRGPPLERVALQARGGLVERQWRGTIERVAYVPERNQLWTLQSPATLVAGPPPATGRQRAAADLVRLGNFCLGSAGQRACVSASFRSAEDWTIDAKASAFALDRVAKLYREDLDLQGVVDATLEAAGGAGGTVSGRAVVHSKEGSFVVPGETELAGRRSYRGAGMRLVAGPEGTRAEAEVELIDVGTVNGFVELPRWNRLGMPPPEQALHGRFVAHASSLEPVLLVSDTFAHPRGRLDADLDLAGTVGQPRLEGSARLTDASAFVVPLGITVRDVQLEARPNDAGEIMIEGSLRSGDGVLEVRGRAPLEPRHTLASIELSGENVLVMDLPDRRVEASTDELTVAWTADGIAASGEVRIPEAQIGLGTEQPEAVSASSDVVFVRLPPGSQRAADQELGLRARVRLLLGDEVHVSGSGLEADVRGSLLILEEPGSPTRATGELDLGGGSFAAYGARLELERGRLIFAESPVTAPAVDLRASRRSGDVVAGIDARGTLDNPRVSLWSEPTMPQAEQLSYLVLGRPLTDVGAQEGDVLTQAAQGLGLRGGRYLATRLGSLFGLEEARIDTGEGGLEQASLVLGEFLSPRLYVAYGVGLFEQGTNSVLVRYLLSKKFTLEAATGESSRADVLYVVETGPGEARPKLEPGLPDRE